MSTLSARVIDLNSYYRTHESFNEAESESHTARIRSLHPYAIGIELMYGDAVIGAWIEAKPFAGIIEDDELANAENPSDLRDGVLQLALDKAVARQLATILFPSPYATS